jgi:hypothetical protein
MEVTFLLHFRKEYFLSINQFSVSTNKKYIGVFKAHRSISFSVRYQIKKKRSSNYPSAAFTITNQPAGTTITWSSSNPSGVSINSSGVAQYQIKEEKMELVLNDFKKERFDFKFAQRSGNSPPCTTTRSKHIFECTSLLIRICSMHTNGTDS